VSVGLYRDPILSGQFSSLFEPHGLNAGLSEAVKKAVSIPVTVVGGINSPELAERLIAEGKCDFVALGRQLTADGAFANKAASERADDIAPCIRCFKCFPGPLEGVIDDLSTLFGCSVNPEAFYFDENVLSNTPIGSRKVLVVGGGIAGMEAAVVAADRGHKVILAEKSHVMGGILNFADFDAYKSDLAIFKNVMIRRVECRPINVLYEKEITVRDIAAFSPDAVILALGSHPIIPDIPGISTTLTAVEAYGKLDVIGKKVVIIGGGLVGCEVGLHLAKNGKEVTVIEMADDVARDGLPMHRIGLIHEMSKMLTVRTGLTCTAVTKEGMQVRTESGLQDFIPADTVICAVGMEANRKEAQELKSAAGNISVYDIGDCVNPGKVFDAMRQAFIAAMSIE
jgi:NADPH-dependent 2,4-dienoyl-CoA reductase/sulfur reductase-like enzyme